ncbi:MAG TPA: ATP-binding protein [Kofleriaceae bacterium]
MKARDSKDLRRRAEAKLGAHDSAVGEHARLLHELEVHTVELEMQNEELRAAREVTEAALARYAEIFDFAPIGYAVLDGDGAIREINHAGAALLGRERSVHIGKRFATLLGDAARYRFDQLLARAQLDARSESCEVELLVDATRRPARLTVAALQRQEPAFVIAFEDITESRAKEIELAKSREALRDMNRRKDEFLAMLSHELRNPLSPIRLSVEVLQLAEPGAEGATKAIGIIERSAAHLTRLVDDLLDVTRIARGKVELVYEPLDLVALVQRTVEDHRASFENRRLQLVTHFAVTELELAGDSARLVQVLSNVLGNAEKFTPPGGVVVISVARVEDEAVVCVRDNGAGIAADVLVDVFEPFTQGPQPLARERGGLGLGLAMVKSLVELHGGRVGITSEGVGKGTEVQIMLPLQRAVLVASRPLRARLAMVPRRVLIVEDIHDNASSLEHALHFFGHEVRVAHTGRVAFEIAVGFLPDVVLCDIGLPDIDGHTLARMIRADEVLRSTYLVALTGYAQAHDVATALAAGFDRHLAKPASLDDILDVIELAGPRDELENKLH